MNDSLDVESSKEILSVMDVDEKSSVVIQTDHDVKAKTSTVWTESQRLNWMICLFVGQIAAHSTRTLMPICSVAISREYRWNKTQMGAVLSCFFWGYMTIQLFSGSLADKIGGELVLLYGALGWAFISLSYAFVDRIVGISYLFIAVVVLRIFNGAFMGFHTPSVASVISTRVLLNQRGFTFTLQNSGTYLGIIISGSVGSILLHYYGWRVPFVVFGLFSIFWIYATRTYLYIPKIHSISEVLMHFKAQVVAECREFMKFLSMFFKSGQTIQSLKLNEIITEECISTTRPKVFPWQSIFSSMPFWAMMIGQFAYGYSHFIILSWLPTYFEEVHHASKGWVFNVLPWLVTIPFSIIGGYLSDGLIVHGYSVTFVRKLMESLSQFGTALFLHLLTYTKSYELALASITLATAFSGFHISGIILNPLDLAPNQSGALFGVMNIAGAFPGFLGVYLCGFILDYFRSWNFVFNHTALICLLANLFYLCFGCSEQII